MIYCQDILQNSEKAPDGYKDILLSTSSQQNEHQRRALGGITLSLELSRNYTSQNPLS